LVTIGKVNHGWRGVLCNSDDTVRTGGGAQIDAVMAGSPAEKAGLQPGDVVVRASGSAVSGRPELVAAVRTLRPQDPLDLQYEREGRIRNTTVNLGAGDPQVLAYFRTMG
jgi:S1-C subfamily serine protease